MKKRISAFILALILVLPFTSCATEQADPSDGEVFSDDSVAESSPESQDESEYKPEASDEPSQSEPVYGETTEQPKIFGCTFVEGTAFVVLGTCEQGATVTVYDDGNEYSSKSDHGYFSVRIPRAVNTAKLTVTAEVTGKNPSEPLAYTAHPKKVSDSQWELIAAADYQFHIKYTLNDYLRNNAYSQATLDGLTAKLQKRVSDLKAVLPDTEIIYMIVPSPASIYPEGMPDIYEVADSPCRLEQVTAAITAASIKVIDLRDVFASHKNDSYKLYWKTDSHWTDYGAFIAYTELFNYIAEKHPECAPRSFDEFEWVEDVYAGGDISYYLEYFGSYGYTVENTPMREYNVLRKSGFEMPTAISSIKRYVSDKQLTYNSATVQNAVTIDTKRTDLPSAIVIRDSYSTQLFDILAERFDKTWYKGMWDFGYSLSEIKQKKPDYIIYIAVERNIDSLFN